MHGDQKYKSITCYMHGNILSSASRAEDPPPPPQSQSCLWACVTMTSPMLYVQCHTVDVWCDPLYKIDTYPRESSV